MKRVILVLFLFITSLGTWAKSPAEEWKEKLVREGQKRLAQRQQANADNDAAGKSAQNSYLVIISPDYPNAEFIQQRKGAGRGGATYLLDQATVTTLDNTLRTMNSRNDIQTYVLLVHFMPLEFVQEIPDNQSIAGFFEGAKTDLMQAIAQPISDEASQLVRSITGPPLSKATKPTLYCGFVNFKVFKNEREGISQWVYYPENSQINFDTEYKNMLTSFVRSTQWPLDDKAKVSKLVEVIQSNNEEYNRIKGAFRNLIAIDNADEMQTQIGKMSFQAMSAFDIGLRVHLLKVLSSGEIPNSREVLIINLIASAQKPQDASQLITALAQVNDKVPATITITPANQNIQETKTIPNPKKGWCLLRCITNETNDASLGIWGGDNYKSLIQSFLALCKQSPDFNRKVAALANTTNNDLIASRTIYYNYNSFWTKLAASFPTFPRVLIDRSTDYISGCRLQTVRELFFNYLLPNSTIDTETLDPFEPIVFVNQSDLGMLSDINEEGNIFVSPAIVLKYADEKAWNQTSSDVSMAAIDAASLATGYGEIKAGVSGMRRAWVVMDMTNSGINLSLNASLSTQNATVRKLLDAYNLVTGGVALVKMGTGGIKSVYGFLKGKRIPKSQDIRALLQTIEEVSEEELRLLPAEDLKSLKKLTERIKAEAQGKGITELEQQAQRVLEKLGKLGKTDDVTIKLGISRPFKIAKGSKGRALLGAGVGDDIIDAKEITLSDKIGELMNEDIIHPRQRDYPSIDAISQRTGTPLSYKQLEIQDKTNITTSINKAYKYKTTGIYNNNIKARNGEIWANGIKYEEWTGVDLHIEYPFSDVDASWLENIMWPAFAKNPQRTFRNDAIIKQIYIHIHDGSVIKMNMSLLNF